MRNRPTEALYLSHVWHPRRTSDTCSSQNCQSWPVEIHRLHQAGNALPSADEAVTLRMVHLPYRISDSEQSESVHPSISDG